MGLFDVFDEEGCILSLVRFDLGFGGKEEIKAMFMDFPRSFYRTSTDDSADVLRKT